MWKLWIREFARTWRELMAGGSDLNDSVTKPRDDREARAGLAARDARLARLRLGMF